MANPSSALTWRTDHADYGLDIAIPFTGDPDPTLPWADDDDALLVPGSLILFDLAHSASPLVGVPVGGDAIPNLAWKRVRDQLGAAVFTGKIDNEAGAAGFILTVTAVAAGAIVLGQQITGTRIGVRTFVLNQLSGTPGGIGRYTVATYVGTGTSTAQTVASTTLTATAGDATNLSGTHAITGDAANIFARERTPKGGYHVAITQTNQTASNGVYIEMKPALEALFATLVSLGHAFYFSMWETVTRPAVAGAQFSPQNAYTTRGVSATGNNLSILGYDAGTTGPTGAVRIGYSESAGNVVGNRFRAVGASGVTGAPVGMASFPFVVGNPLAWGSAAYANKSASRVLYRTYVEDLTVSGRTYGQVLALDRGLFDASFGAGGRYAGDTYTAPLA